MVEDVIRWVNLVMTPSKRLSDFCYPTEIIEKSHELLTGANREWAVGAELMPHYNDKSTADSPWEARIARTHTHAVGSSQEKELVVRPKSAAPTEPLVQSACADTMPNPPELVPAVPSQVILVSELSVLPASAEHTRSKPSLSDDSADSTPSSKSTDAPPSSVDLLRTTSEDSPGIYQLQSGDIEHNSGGGDNGTEGSGGGSGHGVSSSPGGYDRNQPKRRRTSHQRDSNGTGRGSDDDGKDGGEENGAHQGKERTEGRKFACPFFKHDQIKYGSDPTCRGSGWLSSHRVKYLTLPHSNKLIFDH